MGSLNFYSQLQRAVERAPAKMDGQPAQQWLQWLESNAAKLGVKKEEVEWSGVREYLALQGRQRLFRQDLGAFLQENGVRVEEVQLRREPLDPKGFYEVLANDLYQSSYEDLSDRVQSEIRYLAEERARSRGDADNTKYGTYALPGGTRYREVLISLPQRKPAIDTSGWSVKLRREVSPVTRKPEYEVFDSNGVLMGVSRSSAAEQEAILAVARVQERVLSEKLNYTSSHWDQKNVLAHMRVDERMDAEGKRVLLIHEIQSDWAQEGRRQGFEQQQGALLKGTVAEDGYGTWKVVWEDGTFSGGYSYESAHEKAAQGRQVGKVGKPPGPFVGETSAWVGLALKRAVMMAVEGGYDRVALITGQQAVGLYDLSKQVDKIVWRPVDAYGKFARIEISMVNEGPVYDSQYSRETGVFLSGSPYEGKRLDEVVGKEVADKVLVSESGNLSGEGLRMGGEGMVVFYDRIVPQVARDVLKKLGGGSLGEVNLDRTSGYRVEDSGRDFIVYDPQGNVERRVASRRTAEQVVEELAGGAVQPGFDITPAMREAVMGGVPLFSLASDSEVLDNPSTPDAVRDVIADLVGVDAQQLQDGVGRLVVTTSGDVRAQVEAARKAAFDAWFAGSKVVSKEGKPLVVYHGTAADISAFKLTRNGEFGPAIYTTDSAGEAGAYAADAGSASLGQSPVNVMPVYVDLKKPFTDGVEAFWKRFHREGDVGQAMAVNRAKAAGYDGVIATRLDWRDRVLTHYIAFNPEQIKSAIGNRGTYDPRDPDITHSLAPQRAQAFHDRQSGTTYFLADRIPAGKEASVFLHEVVHRHGRTALPQERFGQLVGQVKDWAGHAQGSTERSIHDKAAGRVAAAGVSGPVADEELFAYAVEEAVAMGVQPSAMAHEGSAEAWLNAVVQSIQRVADKLIGNSLEQLGGQDLVDLAYALAQVERPELGAVVAQTLQEHCGISLQPTFSTESRDGPSGQQNLTLRARLDEESVGYIDYTVYRDVPAIQYVWVDEKHRRQGVAGAMVRELQREFPDQEIEWGMLTDDGAKLYESLSKQYIENPEFLELKSRLDLVLERLAHHKQLGEEFDALCSPTEQQRREFLEAVTDWNDLHDERFELTQALYDVRPGRVMILCTEQAALEEVPSVQEMASMAL